MSAEARIAQAARDTASELDGIGLMAHDNIAKALRHFADFTDGREASPSNPSSGRRQRARNTVSEVLGDFTTRQGWTVASYPSWTDLIDEIIDAVDLA